MLRVNIYFVNCLRFMMWVIEILICYIEYIILLVLEVFFLFFNIGRYFNLFICLDLKRGNCFGNIFLFIKLNWFFS